MLALDIDRGPGALRVGESRSRPRPSGRARNRTVRDQRDAGHAWSHPWTPLAGPALLERLRCTGRPRPTFDPEFAQRLRAALEEGLSVGRAAPRSSSLVVTKDRLTRVLACEAHDCNPDFGERPPTAAMACGALVDALFRQLVCVGEIGDPMADGLAALSVDDHQGALVSWIERMQPAERDELKAEVERQVGGLRRRWPTLDPSWLPRTQEALRVQLLGGRIELSARVDLAIGRPAEEEASVAIVEVKSGTRRAEHRADLHFYALVETLRSRSAPFVAATYYTRTGELDVDPVTDELLTGAAHRTLVGTKALWSLAVGSESRRSPCTLCGRCAASPEHVAGRTQGDGDHRTDVGDGGDR